ncbi:membrane protein insertase YidC [Patescibacteria group bacterium]|jgi:YidC/Oxa1 family membrane protein insertase|nr:membrane protein insertase YidC [Patescibacteria group bacterium]
MADLFGTLVYTPLYNALIGFVDIIPGGDLGFSLIALTILIKLLILPLSIKAVKTQLMMKEIEGPLREIQQKYKDDRQKQAEEVMALYKEKGVNPFSMLLVLLIQLPIIFGLYWVFARGGLPEVDPTLLYTFVPEPAVVSMLFLGLIDLGGKSWLLALGAGVSQFFQAKLAMPAPPEKKDGEAPSFKDDFARSMHLQVRYVLPVFVTFAAYYISAAVALYWVTSNIFTILQELYVRRTVKRPHEEARKQREEAEAAT